MYKTILVPVDIDEEKLTENALKHVEYLAKASGAKVHFFHALPDASAFVTAYSFGIKEFENQAETQAIDKLKKNNLRNGYSPGAARLHHQFWLTA
ncbi:Universal stress protein G [Serratia odorifera]|uniref:Universal stress protein G n=1 Tax=Serratia odorifera TaxID=618 RepID=A0A447L0R4_SEROD|nr:Universal stress protein G [Serratia odorifera]